MSSKKVKSLHPDMERALNPDEKTVTVPKEIQFFTDYEGPPLQHQSTKRFSKPRYLPRQFKNLPSYFQLESDVAPKSSMDERCSKTCFSIEHHEFFNPMTPEELLKNYYGEEEFPLGEDDDPPLHAYEKPWEIPHESDKTLLVARTIQGGTMIKFQADEPAPPEYQDDRPKTKKVNKSGSGKKKSAKAKKKAAKAKKLAKATKSSASATFNQNNSIPITAEEPPGPSSANEGQEMVPLPPPPPYEQLEPLSDILIKIRIYKPFDVEENENGTNILYQNVTENHNVPDIRTSFYCSEERNSMNKVNKGLLVMNNELSGDKTFADDDADYFKKWYAAGRLADSAKSNAYSWWPDRIECLEHFKLFPDAALNTCFPAHLKFSYEYIQCNPKSIGATCGHVPGNTSSFCQQCFKGILRDDEGDKTCQYNRRQYKSGEDELRSY